MSYPEIVADILNMRRYLFLLYGIFLFLKVRRSDNRIQNIYNASRGTQVSAQASTCIVNTVLNCVNTQLASIIAKT